MTPNSSSKKSGWGTRSLVAFAGACGLLFLLWRAVGGGDAVYAAERQGVLQDSGVVTYDSAGGQQAVEVLNSDPQSKGVRQAYIESLTRSAKLKFDSPGNVMSVIARNCIAELRTNPKSTSLFVDDRAEQRLDLALQALSKWVFDLDAEAYLQWRLGTGETVVATLDEQFRSNPELMRIADEAGLTRESNPDVAGFLRAWADQARVEQESSRVGPAKVNGLAFGEAAWLVKPVVLTHRDQDFNQFYDDLSPQDGFYWVGKLAQGAYFVSGPGVSLDELRERDGQAIVVTVIVIARTTGFDAYPVHFRLAYDPKRQSWLLNGFSRRSSLRLPQPMVF
jgi:hypothetical protein